MKKNYEVFFVIVLIVIIGLCILQLTGVSAAFQERIHAEKECQDNMRIASAYYFTKLKQSDVNEGIRIAEDKLYIYYDDMETCIFCEDGVLYESNVIEGVEHSVDTSFEVTEIDTVHVTKNGDKITILTIKDDMRRDVTVRVRAAKEVQ